MDNFHKRLKTALKERGLSQNALAKILGVKQASVWEWLNISFPSLERFQQICIILNVSADKLLGLPQEQGKGNTYNNNGIHNGDVNF